MADRELLSKLQQKLKDLLEKNPHLPSFLSHSRDHGMISNVFRNDLLIKEFL